LHDTGHAGGGIIADCFDGKFRGPSDMKKNNILKSFQPLTVAVLISLAMLGCGGNSGEGKADEPAASAQAKKVEASPRSGYACCNLHYEGDWISDANLSQQAFIPVGSPVSVKKFDGFRVNVEIDGKPMRLGHDYGRAEESTEQWVSKLVVAEDPRLKIAKFPPAIREAIKAGKLMKGMTKEQVIMAVGHPQTNDNPQLDGPYWRYWWSSFGPYYVYWSGNKVSKISGHSETVGNMTYKGK
jgi:hypothetical protein